jgi:uncharacterized protein YjbJ (UPF0337 family)
MGEISDKLKGKAKQVEGDITGDRERHAEGTLDELKGKVKGKFEEVKQGIKDRLHKS